MSAVPSVSNQSNGSVKPDFSNVPVASLESLRLRLTQLTHSLAKLSDAMQQSQSLPHWSSLQNQFNVILSQLTSLSRTLDSNYEVLRGTNVFPTVDFPTTQQEGLLTTLLRKKPLPDVSDWINDSYSRSEASDVRKDDEFSSWCIGVSEEAMKGYTFEGYLTQKEIDDGVELGPEFAHEDSEENSGPVPGLGLSQMLRFVYQGADWQT
ncbi:unnamed protein product [Kuraishia capsulata CBS 1993]|uniref:Mediator of RNA polymerase II transcription subunit 8 n=1 Tax=Kuraishia capsulata CBS 1993 TaxID=1382522 RepID=W6MTP1_9ASCO|nr:uncharacterized protein KUCA_T00001127001 [Kuraishia capsulata CBS 1993]CDK25160.1 unnamed protein product [Kuraishia capsulata CBS 1993]